MFGWGNAEPNPFAASGPVWVMPAALREWTGLTADIGGFQGLKAAPALRVVCRQINQPMIGSDPAKRLKRSTSHPSSGAMPSTLAVSMED
jgi:hypothetical protein